MTMRLRNEFQSRETTQPKRRVIKSPIGTLPARLWEKLASNAGISPETIWTSLTREEIECIDQATARDRTRGERKVAE